MGRGRAVGRGGGAGAGAARLKEALEAEGLKVGGTVRQRAERLMLLRDTPRDQLDRKHFAKGIIPQARNTPCHHRGHHRT